MHKLVHLMLMCCAVLLFLVLLIREHVSDPVNNGPLGVEPFHCNCSFWFLFGHIGWVCPGPILITSVYRVEIMRATVNS